MKAVRIHEFGGPDQVHVEDVPLPKVARGKALVRIRAAGVNPVDWMVREHIYNPKGADRVPLTLGQDFAGVVERIGAGSKTSLREGDEVFGEVFGSFAEFALVPVKDLVKKPASLDFNLAAALPMPALTAWQAIVDTARARRGMRFLIHGASAGLVEKGVIKPHISKILPLDQARQAMDLNQQGKSHGKVVLEIR